MVNTRILEQRLGWRSAEPGDEPTPPTRPIAHTPVLQGRIEPAPASVQRGLRRLAIEEAWDALPRIDADADRLVEQARVVPSIGRNAVAGRAMDQLRAQLMRVIRQNGWRRIGIASPTRGAGRSFVAVGLAASLARLDGVRVLLLDGDIEDPGLAEILGVEAPGALEEVLTGTRPAASQIIRIGNALAVALNDTPVTYGAELLLSPDAILGLRAMTDLLSPEVTIVDMPPLLSDSVALALLPQLDAVLLISDGLRSTAQDIVECERLLEDQVPIVGVILNKSEDRDPRPRARRRG